MAALLVGIVISFFVMEGALRLYNPLDFRVKGDRIILPVKKTYVIDTEKELKNSRGSAGKFDKTIIHTKNSLGFRGEEPPVNINKYLAIITVGGSTTECTFLTDGKTWTDILKRNLEKSIQYIWINNAGFDGHSTFGHKILMEDFIVKLKPDIVLFLVGANDFGLDNFSEFDMRIMKNKYIFSTLKGFLISMANHSEVFSLGLNMYRYGKSKVVGVDHAVLDFEIFRKKDINEYLSDEAKERDSLNLQEHKRKYLKGFESRLKTLIEISRIHNIVPVFITQPTLYGDFIDDITNIDFKFTEHPWNVLEIYNDVTRKVGIEENILVVDLANEMPKSTKYYYDWFHFTNEGAEKVAEIIYKNS